MGSYVASRKFYCRIFNDTEKYSSHINEYKISKSQNNMQYMKAVGEWITAS